MVVDLGVRLSCVISKSGFLGRSITFLNLFPHLKNGNDGDGHRGDLLDSGEDSGKWGSKA